MIHNNIIDDRGRNVLFAFTIKTAYDRHNIRVKRYYVIILHYHLQYLLLIMYYTFVGVRFTTRIIIMYHTYRYRYVSNQLPVHYLAQNRNK